MCIKLGTYYALIIYTDLLSRRYACDFKVYNSSFIP